MNPYKGGWQQFQALFQQLYSGGRILPLFIKWCYKNGITQMLKGGGVAKHWIWNLEVLGSSLWSGFYIKINLPTFVFLCTKLCTNNVQVVRTTSRLYEQRPRCTNDVHVVRTTSTLYERRPRCTNDVHVVRTTSTLYERRPCCTNDVHVVRTTSMLYERRPRCTNDVHVVRTTTTLQGQRQLCQKFMYDPMKSPEHLSPVCMAPWNFLRL